MDNSKKYLSIAFVVILVVVVIVSALGIWMLGRKPVILQGQIEATEIRISGKLPGRIDTFLVEEGQNVRKGDTLVVINSPEALAKYEQVNAMENIAVYQNQKIDDGTRKQIVESARQLWNKSKTDLSLAKVTGTASSRRSAKMKWRRFIKRHKPENGPPTNSTRWRSTERRNRIVKAPGRWSMRPAV